MQKTRKPSKTFQQVEHEAQAVDKVMAQLGSDKAKFEKSRTGVALEVGAILATAQDKLARYGDGVFIRWTQERLRLQKTTAYKWLRLHERFGDCPQCVQNIDISGLYILSEVGPAYNLAFEDAMASAPKGNRVKRNSVIRMLQNHRDTAISKKWKDDDVPEVPGDLTSFQKLAGIWLRTPMDERRKFKKWAVKLERSRKRRGELRRKARVPTTINIG